MIIAERKHHIKSSDFWIVTPDLNLTLNVWTKNPNTYFIGEPIFIKDSNKLIVDFEIGFPNPKIDLMDSTILENDIELHFNTLDLEFNNTSLFKISNVKINGETRDNEKLTINTKTQFGGFEILKIDNHIELQRGFENWLKISGVKYELEDDRVNGIIYLKIKNCG